MKQESFSAKMNQMVREGIFKSFYLTTNEINSEIADKSRRSYRDFTNEFSIKEGPRRYLPGYLVDSVNDRIMSGAAPYSLKEMTYFYWAASGIICNARLAARKEFVAECFARSYFKLPEEKEEFEKWSNEIYRLIADNNSCGTGLSSASYRA